MYHRDRINHRRQEEDWLGSLYPFQGPIPTDLRISQVALPLVISSSIITTLRTTFPWRTNSNHRPITAVSWLRAVGMPYFAQHFLMTPTIPNMTHSPSELWWWYPHLPLVSSLTGFHSSSCDTSPSPLSSDSPLETLRGLSNELSSAKNSALH